MIDEQVFDYLDCLNSQGIDEIDVLHQRVMSTFELPPNRVHMLIDAWIKKSRAGRTVPILKRHPWDLD